MGSFRSSPECDCWSWRWLLLWRQPCQWQLVRTQTLRLCQSGHVHWFFSSSKWAQCSFLQSLITTMICSKRVWKVIYSLSSQVRRLPSKIPEKITPPWVVKVGQTHNGIPRMWSLALEVTTTVTQTMSMTTGKDSDNPPDSENQTCQ